MNNKWLRQTIQAFKPYAAPKINESIVIDANESPYNIFDFPQVAEAFLARMKQTPSYHYPIFAGLRELAHTSAVVRKKSWSEMAGMKSSAWS